MKFVLNLVRPCHIIKQLPAQLARILHEWTPFSMNVTALAYHRQQLQLTHLLAVPPVATLGLTRRTENATWRLRRLSGPKLMMAGLAVIDLPADAIGIEMVVSGDF